MATFVIVHGAFGGGWEWTPVANELRARGHDAFTVTLTGLGERSHLGPIVSLSTNVRDITALIEFEDLHDVILCAASYGGMAATWAADLIAERIAGLIYVDALIPRDGECGLDLLPADFGDVVRASPDGWAELPAEVLPPESGVSPDTRQHYVARLRPQPAGTFTEKVSLFGRVDRIPSAFVRCTKAGFSAGRDPIAPMAERARGSGWRYRELPLPHDPHLYDPAATAGVLEELARSA